MSSYSTKYRKEHPEYYEKERIIDWERVKSIYHNNPEYREKVKQRAVDRYYRLKALKPNTSILESIFDFSPLIIKKNDLRITNNMYIFIINYFLMFMYNMNTPFNKVLYTKTL